MSAWVLVEVAMFLALSAAVGALWMRMLRPVKDDPRLSKGLQLLQSKIAVLEDLSDRTENQVQQMTSLLEQKYKELHQKIQQADREIHRIDQATQKSLEVAEIFQDKIPHQEIVERQNTLKHIKAARLAHQGSSIEDIQKQVDLSLGEIELIARVNKEQLVFSEEDLPAWAKKELEPESPSSLFPGALDLEITSLNTDLQKPSEDEQTLKQLGEAFRQAQKINHGAVNQETARPEDAHGKVANQEAPQRSYQESNRQKDMNIRPVVFRKIDLSGDLS